MTQETSGRAGREISDRVRELSVFKFAKREGNDSRLSETEHTFSYLLKEVRGETSSALKVRYGISYAELIEELRELVFRYGNGYVPDINDAGCVFSWHEKEGIEKVFKESDSGRRPKS